MNRVRPDDSFPPDTKFLTRRIVQVPVFSSDRDYVKMKAMWKKALWLYLGLYALGIFILIVYTSIRDISDGTFLWTTPVVALLAYVPAGVVAFGLRGKKVPILLTLFGLLIVAVPVVAIFNFNNLDLATIGKAFLFQPLIAGLIYFGYKRLFRKQDLSY